MHRSLHVMSPCGLNITVVGTCWGQTCAHWLNMWTCMFHVIAAWRKYDMGAWNVLPVTCGWRVKGCYWLREFRMPSWPRFLFSPFPTLGIHGNVCVCECVHESASALPLSFPLQRGHCPILGQAMTNVPNCPCACTCTCVYLHDLCELSFMRLVGRLV